MEPPSAPLAAAEPETTLPDHVSAMLCSPTDTKRYLIQFRAQKMDFVLAELNSLLHLQGLKAEDVYKEDDFDLEVPFLRVNLPSDEVVQAICSRAILIKNVFDLWGSGRDYDELKASILACPSQFKEPYFGGERFWKISFDSFGNKATNKSMNKKREALLASQPPPLEFKGKVKLSGDNVDDYYIIEAVFDPSARLNPNGTSKTTMRRVERKKRKLERVEAAILAGRQRKTRAERAAERAASESGAASVASMVSETSMLKIKADREQNLSRRLTREPDLVFFGRLVATPPSVDKYTLKRRAYLGPTSMEHEMAFLMAQQGLARPGSMVLDPFFGTGGVMIPCAALGAVCFGGDMDYWIFKGKEEKSVVDSYKQYGLPLPELFRWDFSPEARSLREPQDGLFDAIVTDPPYGIRAGARKVGSASNDVKPVPKELVEDHVPMTKIYEVDCLMVDLVDAAARLLRTGGRLVYLLPVNRSSYTDAVIPQHECLQMLSNNEERLKYPLSRRLITMEKVKPYDFSRAAEYVEASRAALHTPAEFSGREPVAAISGLRETVLGSGKALASSKEESA